MDLDLDLDIKTDPYLLQIRLRSAHWYPNSIQIHFTLIQIRSDWIWIRWILDQIRFIAIPKNRKIILFELFLVIMIRWFEPDIWFYTSTSQASAFSCASIFCLIIIIFFLGNHFILSSGSFAQLSRCYRFKGINCKWRLLNGLIICAWRDQCHVH